jgi:predicted PurR-regulated permease PerM
MPESAASSAPLEEDTPPAAGAARLYDASAPPAVHETARSAAPPAAPTSQPRLTAEPLVRVPLILATIIGVLWLVNWVWQLLARFADILLLFFLAWLLAFLLSPLVRVLRQRSGVSQLAAVATVYAALGLSLLLAVLIALPALTVQLTQFGAALPNYAERLQALAQSWHAELVARGLPPQALEDLYRNGVTRLEAYGAASIQTALSLATGVATLALNAIIVLILSFYITLDGDEAAGAFLRLLPPRYRPAAEEVLAHIDRSFGGFLRGQLIQALIFAIGTAIIMEIAGLGFVLLAAVLSGVLMLIPLIGPFLAMIAPVLVAVLQRPDAFWWVFLALFLLQFVVVNVVAPKIMSQSVGIHPLLVFAAMLVGARIAGAWGVIFGIPIAAVLYVTVRSFYYRVILHTPLYQPAPPRRPLLGRRPRDSGAAAGVPPEDAAQPVPSEPSRPRETVP